jgi:hypothetical protein
MGINRAHNLTCSLNNLDLGQLVMIAIARLHEKQNASPTFRRDVPTIDLDCSWVVRRCPRESFFARVEYLWSISKLLAQAGFFVMLVCDSNKRHHSKRATYQRESEEQHHILEMILKKSELMQMSQRRQQTDSVSEREKLESKANILQKRIRSLEKYYDQSKIDVGDKLYNELKKKFPNLP